MQKRRGKKKKRDEATAPRSSLRPSLRRYCCCGDAATMSLRNTTAFDGSDRASWGQEREEDVMKGKKFNRHVKHIGQAVSTAFSRCFPCHHPHHFSPNKKTHHPHKTKTQTKTISQSIFLILLQMSATYRELHYSYFT